jgi:BirA family biotin operon repressor/biotin-[acetyl-CoA-carboxylase] ligase
MIPKEFAEAIAAARPRLGRLASKVEYYPTIGSTNDAAASMSATEGAVVFADAQTEGRGRRGHIWFSPAATGLYVSVVLAPSRAAVDPRRAVSLTTIAAGVALAEGIEKATALPNVRLKWPNDLYVGRRKLGGILAEGSAAGDRIDVVVVGYGINIAKASFPPDLRARVTSIETELGKRPSRARVLAETLAALAARYDDLLAGRFDAILDSWRERAHAKGATVHWETREGTRSGEAVGIADDGALLVKVDGVVERIVGGEVTWT